MAVTNITIADKSRLDFIMNFLSRFGVTDVHIQKESFGYDVSFGGEANYFAVDELSKMFPTEDDADNVWMNCVVVSKPKLFT